ncbi:MAG: DUF6672 family protein [Cetobacterium sp.]
MKKNVGVILFFMLIILISGGLYIFGQEHTLIVNNNYFDKDMSKNMIITILNQKPKKISKNRKSVIELKGINHKFIVEVDGIKKEGTLKFSLNRGVELSVENFMKNNENYLKKIRQY